MIETDATEANGRFVLATWIRDDDDWVVVNVQPRETFFNTSVNDDAVVETSAEMAFPGLTGYCVDDNVTDAAGYISYQA